MPINSRVIVKKMFSAAILNFLDENGSRFFKPIYCTDYYYRSKKFAIRILKLSQLVLELFPKYRVLATILNFLDESGSR